MTIIHKRVTVLLAALCAILAIVVTVLGFFTFGLYREIKEVELTDHELYYLEKCNSYRTQNFNLSKGQIVFVGDSITDLYVLDDHYGDLSLATYNRGIGGDTTSGVLERLQVSVYDIKPSKVVLMIGTNDINGGSELDEIMDRYEKIVSGIISSVPGVELYCMSLIPQNELIEEYSPIRVENTIPKIISINDRIKNLAESKGAVYIDLFTHLADENNLLIREFSDDGLHLNTAGLEVWTNLIKPYLSEDRTESE